MDSVIHFFKNNIGCDIFLALGLLALYITYIGAPRASKKAGHYVSGIPGVGGILIVLGFLTSSVKWLAILGLFEPALLFMIFRGIPDIIKCSIETRKWTPPEEFEGGHSVAVSKYKNRYEECRVPIPESDTDFMGQSVVRYIIIKTDDGYQLLRQAMNGSITTREDFKTVDECKKATSPKAKWRNLSYEQQASE